MGDREFSDIGNDIGDAHFDLDGWLDKKEMAKRRTISKEDYCFLEDPDEDLY